MADFTKVAAADLKPGMGVCVEVGGKEIAVFNHGGAICALDNVCPHQGGPLSEGEIQDGRVVCPWHGWMFDLKTGQSPVSPAIKVAAYEAKMEGNDILVKA